MSAALLPPVTADDGVLRLAALRTASRMNAVSAVVAGVRMTIEADAEGGDIDVAEVSDLLDLASETLCGLRDELHSVLQSGTAITKVST